MENSGFGLALSDPRDLVVVCLVTFLVSSSHRDYKLVTSVTHKPMVV